MAALAALSPCLRAVSVALDIEHPDLLSRPSTALLDTTALVLRIHLDECQQILRDYDEMLFEGYLWAEATPDEHDQHDDPRELDDDIPF